ncbi:MAG: glycosyltransferase family 1 protein [Woeseiaceae bacterium]|nr:glycosyltransferase family 1 protein [Woeseiaceae bacterium]
MKRVLIDLERLRAPNSGLGQVALYLGRELAAMQSDDWEPVFLLPSANPELVAPGVSFEVPTLMGRHFRRWRGNYDLWHVLHQDARLLPPKATPYLLTVHDLNFLGEKSGDKAARRLQKVQKLVDGAAAISVISGYTRSVIEQHLALGDTPVHVIYNGIPTAEPGQQTRPGFLPDGPFLFTVGVVRPKKNFHVLVDMLKHVAGFNLVIAGNRKGDYAEQLEAQATDKGLADRVFVCGEVTDEEKNWLFANCTAFLFPSLYEGFGLPLVEAMSYGKPSFSSTRTSLPEVGGNDVVYWDSFDAEGMAQTFHDGLAAFEADPQRSERLRQRAAGFSWAAAAKDYAALYLSLLRTTG